MTERWLRYTNPSDSDYSPVSLIKSDNGIYRLVKCGRMPHSAFDMIHHCSDRNRGEIALFELDPQTQHKLLSEIVWFSYAETQGAICRFRSRYDRDQWVQISPATRFLFPSPITIHRIETLAQYGLVSWDQQRDRDANLTYELPAQIIPGQLVNLPPEQAKSYWLCDHPSGPEIPQQRAAMLLNTTQGNISNQLKSARQKRDEESP
jgi:hypothetical protein